MPLICSGVSTENNEQVRKKIFLHLIFCLSSFIDFNYAQYHGDSYLEFQGLQLKPQNNIRLEFQTYSCQGLLLYIEQSPAAMGQFFIQLFIKHGTLQVGYHFFSFRKNKRVWAFVITNGLFSFQL